MLKKFFHAGIGGAIGQVLNFVALPILSRLYSPADYAQWAIVIATATIVGAIACFRFELSIVLPNKDEDASSILWGCVLLAVVSISLLSIGLMWASPTLLIGTPTTELAFNPNIATIPIIAFCFATSNILIYHNIRHESYALNSFATILLTAFTVGGQVALAEAGKGSAAGLIYGTVIGRLAGILTLTLGMFYYRTTPRLNRTVLQNIPSQLKPHSNFPKYSTPYALFGVLRDRAALFILEYFVSPTQVGLYAFIQRLMNFPVTLVSDAIRPVLYQAGAERGVKALEEQVDLLIKWFAIVGSPILVIYFVYAEDLILFLFGPKWVGAGPIGKLIAFPIFTFVFVNWMDRIMDLLGQQRTALILQVSFSVASVSTLCIGFCYRIGFTYCLVLYSCVLVAYNLSYLVIAFDRAGYVKTKIITCVFRGIVSASSTYIMIALLRLL